MTRLTDAELEELELVAASNAGKRTLRCVCDTLPALLAELRALRAVREAAEAYRLVVARFNTTYREDGQSSIDLDQAEANLFNALDKAQ